MIAQCFTLVPVHRKLCITTAFYFQYGGGEGVFSYIQIGDKWNIWVNKQRNPNSEGIGGFVMLCIALCGHGSGPLVPSKQCVWMGTNYPSCLSAPTRDSNGTVIIRLLQSLVGTLQDLDWVTASKGRTASEYKVDLSDDLHLMKKHSYRDCRSLFQDWNDPSAVHKVSVNRLTMGLMWPAFDGLFFSLQSSTPRSLTAAIWTWNSTTGVTTDIPGGSVLWLQWLNSCVYQ